MNIRGHIHNGVVVLENAPPLPEGMPVTVQFPDPAVHSQRKRVELPLVPSANPGSIRLTAERVAELLGELSAMSVPL